MRDHDELQRLLRLKKYESPGEEYFENFLGDFHERQRTDILRKSSRSLFFERVGTWFSGFGREKWLLAGGVSYAAIMLSLYLKPDEPEAMPIRHSADPVLRSSYSLQAIDYEEPTPAASRGGVDSAGTASSTEVNPAGGPFLNLDELKFPLESGVYREF